MNTKRTRKMVAISLILTFLLTVVMPLGILPSQVNAATGEVTIDVSTLGGSDADNSANVATESQWSYDSTNKDLALNTPGGNYTITGTNTDIAVWVTNNINVTLNNANISYTGSVNTLSANNGFIMTLVGTNSIKYTGSDNMGGLTMGGGAGTTYTINGSGSLVAEGNYYGIDPHSDATLRITDNATVTANKILSTGIYEIGDSAKLIYTSRGDDITFTKADATTTHKWKITNATTTDALTDTNITVTATSGAIVTIERECIPNLPVISNVIAKDMTGTSAIVEYDLSSDGLVYLSIYTGTAQSLTASQVKAAAGSVYNYSIYVPVGTSWAFAPTILSPNTQYTAYLVATNEAGDSAVQTVTFTTPAPTSYAVIYDLNGGSGTTPTETSKAEGSTFTAKTTAGITAPAGKQFKEWNQNAHGTATAHAAGSTITMPAHNLTLFAIWEDVPATNIYTITSGAKSTWEKGTLTGLQIICDGDFDKFEGVTVDGVLIVNPDDYTAKAGSTIVTLKPGYLAKLSEGVHTIRFLYADGDVETTFTIAKEKAVDKDQLQMGDTTYLVIASIVLLVSLAGLVALKPRKKKTA